MAGSEASLSKLINSYLICPKTKKGRLRLLSFYVGMYKGLVSGAGDGT